MRDVILAGMAKAFFGSAWADYVEEHDVMSLMGTEILDVMPTDIDPAALHAANTLLLDLERLHKQRIEDLWQQHSGGLDADKWGHYAAMSAMGHGVGLGDWDVVLKIPYMEFGAYSLTYDYDCNGRV